MSIKQRWYKFKPLPDDIKGRLGKLNGLFEQEDVLLAYVFGSLAQNKTGEDVDLAVFPAKDNFTDLRGKLYEALGTERLDLVNLKTASPVLRFEIIKSGRLIYKKNDEIENDFELATLKEYKDTAHLRRRQMQILEERTRHGYKT